MGETVGPPLIHKQDGNGSERDIKDLASGALVSTAGKLGRISRVVFHLVVINAFGWAVYGLYSTAWGMTSTFNKVARFGLQRGVVRFAAAARAVGQDEEAHAFIGTALSIGLLAGLLVSGLIFFSADWVADLYGIPIGGALQVMGFSAPFMALAWIFVSATRVLRIMRYGVYVLSIVGPLVLLAGGFIAGWLEAGLMGLAWASLGMAVCSCILAGFYFSRNFSLQACWQASRRQSHWRRISRFSLPVMLADLLYAALVQLDKWILPVFFNLNPVLIGVYALARQLSAVMLKAAQSFDPIFSSVISELAPSDQVEAVIQRFVVISRWIMTINLPIFLGVLLVGEDLLSVTAKGKFGSAELELAFKILFLLSLGTLVQGTFAIIEALLAMSDRPRLNFYNNLCWLATNFVLGIVFIHIYGKGTEAGLIGFSVATTLSMVAVNILRLIQVKFIYGILPFQRSQLKPLLASLAGLGTAWVVARWFAIPSLLGIILTLSVFIIIYLVALWGLGLEEEDQALLRRLGRRLRRAVRKAPADQT